jgi:hypothetical protein
MSIPNSLVGRLVKDQRAMKWNVQWHCPILVRMVHSRPFWAHSFAVAVQAFNVLDKDLQLNDQTGYTATSFITRLTIISTLACSPQAVCIFVLLTHRLR